MKDKKILLVAINSKYIHSNLAVYCLKSAAAPYENLVHIKEYSINNQLKEILRWIYEEKPDVIGFSCYIWNVSYVTGLVEELAKIMPNVHIWLGGPEVSYNANDYVSKYPFIKGVMKGEGEEIFRQLVACYANDDMDGITRIDGITMNYNGEIIDNSFMAPMAELCQVPYDIDALENRIIYYESSRGCPFSCSYCLSSIDKKLRFRDLELVKKELLFFLKNRVSQVKFIDRTFNCKADRAEAIWQFIKDNDNGYTNFHFEISADLITDKQIEILNSMRPGAVQLEIGVQTTNEDSIKAIRRKMDIGKLREVVAKLKSAKNIHLHLDLIAGLPFEDIVSFRASFNDVYNMEPDELQLGFLKILYGSTMYDDANQYGIVCKSFPPYEVLYTDWLSFEDVLSLKKTEEVVEVYYGTGQFVNSINYLIQFFETPYDFYKALGEFYSEKSDGGKKHSRIDRYNILLDFAKGLPCDIEKVKSLLTYDIYVRENIKTRPPFAVDASIYKEAIKAFAMDNNIDKSCHIEVMDNTFVVFDYSKRNPLNHNASVEIYKIK